MQAVKSLTNSASLIFCQIIYVQATDESSKKGRENKKKKTEWHQLSFQEARHDVGSKGTLRQLIISGNFGSMSLKLLEKITRLNKIRLYFSLSWRVMTKIDDLIHDKWWCCTTVTELVTESAGWCFHTEVTNQLWRKYTLSQVEWRQRLDYFYLCMIHDFVRLKKKKKNQHSIIEVKFH